MSKSPYRADSFVGCMRCEEYVQHIFKLQSQIEKLETQLKNSMVHSVDRNSKHDKRCASCNTDSMAHGLKFCAGLKSFWGKKLCPDVEKLLQTEKL